MALRCLLVDDNARFRESARALLEREGLEVTLAAAGDEAVQRLREAYPDIVLVDIFLGAESGIDLSYALHETGQDGLRIILISTHASDDFQDLIDASPALGFLPKSYLSAASIRELLERAD